MRISTEEQRAIQHVINLGDVHGFGNLIAHLKTAWARKLMDEMDMDEFTALCAADVSPYPIAMHIDVVEGGFWDETGKRYNKPDAKGTDRKNHWQT